MAKYRFGDICKVLNGRAYKQNELLASGKYPILRVGNFFSSDRWYYSDMELPEDKYCDYEDLLFAWSASFGPKIWDGEKVIYHYHIWKLIPNDDIADKWYLYYWLRHSVNRLTAGTHGSVMAHMTKGDMENQSIELPSLQTQRKISSILRTIDEKIHNNVAINNNLEQQAQLLFQSWFSNTNRYINNDWHIRKFGEVASFSQGMQVPISKQLLFPAHGYERFIRIVDITQPSNQDIRYIKSTDKGKVFASDIFMIRYGSPGIVARNYEGIIANNLFTIYPTIAELSNDYIYYYLKSNDIKKYIVQNAVSSTMPAINFSTLKNLDIIIPDRISMQRFTDFSKTVRLIQYNIKQENQRLAQLRDTLLPKLMSGELDVSDIDL